MPDEQEVLALEAAEYECGVPTFIILSDDDHYDNDEDNKPEVVCAHDEHTCF